jgi:hypothetical protein
MSAAESWARGWPAFLERDEFEVARQRRPDDRQRLEPVSIETRSGARGDDGHSQSRPHEAHYRRELSNGHRVLKGYALLDASASIARRVRESLGNETRGSRAICYPQQVRSRGYATSWPNRSSDSSVAVPASEKTASIRRNEESDAHYYLV